MVSVPEAEKARRILRLEVIGIILCRDESLLPFHVNLLSIYIWLIKMHIVEFG